RLEEARNVSIALNKAGRVRRKRGDGARAEQMFEESLEISRGLAVAQPESEQAARDVSIALELLGEVQLLRSNFTGAEHLFAESCEIRKGLVAAQPDSVQAAEELRTVQKSMAIARGAHWHNRWVGWVRRAKPKIGTKSSSSNDG
ncbi:MAG: tetratricopeptide repeat protein, partial [Thermomicrobiales bacterium]|nr:tetratricopeptide repeat protein [Thermomicrobiales bacterium]